MALGVRLSRYHAVCVCAALVSATKVTRCIQCCLVMVAVDEKCTEIIDRLTAFRIKISNIHAERITVVLFKNPFDLVSKLLVISCYFGNYYLQETLLNHSCELSVETS